MTDFVPATAPKCCAGLIAMLIVIGSSSYNPVMAAETAIEVTVVAPGKLQRPEPETAPGGTVVLRGRPVSVRPPAPRSNSAYQPVSPSGRDRSYGVDRSFNNNFDNTGFDRHFDGSGLTR